MTGKRWKGLASETVWSVAMIDDDDPASKHQKEHKPVVVFGSLLYWTIYQKSSAGCQLPSSSVHEGMSLVACVISRRKTDPIRPTSANIQLETVCVTFVERISDGSGSYLAGGYKLGNFRYRNRKRRIIPFVHQDSSSINAIVVAYSLGKAGNVCLAKSIG